MKCEVCGSQIGKQYKNRKWFLWVEKELEEKLIENSKHIRDIIQGSFFAWERECKCGRIIVVTSDNTTY